jgi:putative endonuclease
MPRTYFVYVLVSASRELYVGVTGNIARRVAQHRTAAGAGGYTARHLTTRLVYCESTDDILTAILREKQIKGWTRRKKIELVEQMNPDWQDFAEGW